MKSIKTQLMEALASSNRRSVNEAKEFNFKEFDKQVQAVDKLFKNKSQLNNWAKEELEGNISRTVYQGIDQIMRYLRDFQTECEDNWEDFPDYFEGKYGTYKSEEYVEGMWNGLWSDIDDNLGSISQSVADTFRILWHHCAGEEFPFEM